MMAIVAIIVANMLQLPYAKNMYQSCDSLCRASMLHQLMALPKVVMAMAATAAAVVTCTNT